MTFTELIQAYIDEIKRQQSFAHGSLKSYASALRAYGRWACAHDEYDPLGGPTFVAYYEYLLNDRMTNGRAGLEPSTIKGYFAALHNWGLWLFRMGHTKANPIPDINFAKSNPPIRLLVSDEEIACVLRACALIRDDKHRALLTALLTILTNTAVRHKELLDLKLGDVAIKEKWLYIRKGKGGKKRQIALGDECLAALETWLSARPVVPHDYLWVHHGSHRIAYDTLNPMLADVVFLAGYKDVQRFKCHSLRHNAASLYYRQTKDLHKTMQLLGHSKLETTQKYLHTGTEALMESRNATNRLTENVEEAKPATLEPQTKEVRQNHPTRHDLAQRNGQHTRKRMRSIRSR